MSSVHDPVPYRPDPFEQVALADFVEDEIQRCPNADWVLELLIFGRFVP
jgi:hypothetical protein